MTLAFPLQIESLTVRLDGVALINQLSLNMTPGEKATLSGPSGCGKSTLFRCILGFIKPDAGRIFVRGEAISESSIWRLRREIAYVPQEPDLGEGSLEAGLMRPFAYRANRHLTYDGQRARDLCERFLLPSSLMNKPFVGLSGGEKQRAALASALLLQRPLLLLDEAASALDPSAKAAVRDCLCAMEALTILSISHDVRDFALTGPVYPFSSLMGEEKA